jgi:hypothetical protein
MMMKTMTWKGYCMNSCLHLTLKVLRAHYTSAVAIAEVLPADGGLYFAGYCIVFAVSPVKEQLLFAVPNYWVYTASVFHSAAGLLHVEPAVLPAFAGLHSLHGYYGSGEWYIHCSTSAYYSLVKNMTEVRGYPEDWLADAEVADSEAWYKPDDSELLIWKQGLPADFYRGLLFPDRTLKEKYSPGLCGQEL